MILRTTQSLCPFCLRRLDATYVQENGDVFLQKHCPDHGSFSTLIWRKDSNALDFSAWTMPKTPSYPSAPATQVHLSCPFDCGLCPEHGQHTCTALLEVTSRCNLNCPVCYAGSGGKTPPPDPELAELKALLAKHRERTGPCTLQISGGEPTLRDDLPALLNWARTLNFSLLQLNTNGLRLAQEPGYAERLANAGLQSVYLQWDGCRDESFRQLRGRPCLAVKKKALEHCAQAGLGIVLVATIVKGVNDAELGDLLRFALSQGPCVRGLHLQPAAFFGRSPWPLLTSPRLTLPEVITALATQAPELVSPSDVHPPCCENELCSFSAVYARSNDNRLIRLGEHASCTCQEEPITAYEGANRSRNFTKLHWNAPQNVEQEEQSAKEAFSAFLAQAGLSRRFTLSAMAFQDALSLDLARVRGCCIHVLKRDGRMIPFCLHNMTAVDGRRLYPDDCN